MTLCSDTRTRFESHLTSSASRTHVQDDKDTIRSPRSSAILGPKKKKKKISSITKEIKKTKKNTCFLITLCWYTRTRFQSHLTSSASRMHVQDDKDTIRPPRSSAILGPKKKQKNQAFRKEIIKKKNKKKKNKNKGKFSLLTPLLQTQHLMH